LNISSDFLVSTFAFKFNLYRYMVAREAGGCGNLAPHPALRRIVVQQEEEEEEDESNEGRVDSKDSLDTKGTGEVKNNNKKRRAAPLEAWVLTAEMRDGAYFPGALHAGPRPPAMYADVRGGIFADDPGLGKSVTVGLYKLNSVYP
jgi:hypothetical protein